MPPTAHQRSAAPQQQQTQPQRRLAQFAALGGFLGVGGWKPDPVPILTTVTAVEQLRQRSPESALLWLDEGRKDLVVTLRWVGGWVRAGGRAGGLRVVVWHACFSVHTLLWQTNILHTTGAAAGPQKHTICSYPSMSRQQTGSPHRM